MKFRLPKRKKRPLPADTTCRNCGAQTVGRYCHSCGQDILAGQGQPILTLTGQLLENAFALDGKTPITLACLMTRPGFLSEAYRLGRISRYVHPVKLFWMSTLIFFALLISGIDVSEDKATNIKLPGGNSETKIEQTGQEGTKAGKNMTRAELANYLSTYVPYATFLLMPIFALLLALFFWRKKYYYMYHLTFAVHFHAFLWIYFSLLIIADRIIPDSMEYPGSITALLVFLPGIYLAIALRRFYQTAKRRTAVWKAILITLLYATLIIVVTILIALLVLRFMGLLDD